MFTPEEASYRLYQQTGFLVGAPGSGSGKIVPGEMGFNVKRTRGALTNNQVQSDGVEREFANGNRKTSAEGPQVINFNYLGYLLKAISKTFTSAAFTGVYATAVTAGGTGHVPGTTTITVTGGGGGTGCVIQPVILGGTILFGIVTDPGTGYTSAPALGTTGPGTGFVGTAIIDGTKFIHTSTLGPGTPNYHILEKGVSTFWRLYLNAVLQKMSIEHMAEGICSMGTTWTGSGHVVKGGAPLDGAPVEVTGTPAEYANLTIIQGGVAGGVITKFTSDIETKISEKRPPGYQGHAVELRRGGITVGLSGEAYFEDETLASTMENGTKAPVQSVTTSPDGVFSELYPEVKFEVDDWERRDDGIYIPVKGHSIKSTSSNAPAKFTLINGTSSY